MAASSTELLARANAAAIRFLNAEVETRLTVARIAERTRDADKKDRCRHYARLAYPTAFSCFGTTRGTAKQLREIDLKLSELREWLGPDEEL